MLKRRTLLHNLFASIVAVPVVGTYDRSWGHALVEPEDERHMTRIWFARLNVK